jgi:hypothetical protein
MWFGSAQQLAMVQLDLISVFLSRVSVIYAAMNFGVIVESQLSISA